MSNEEGLGPVIWRGHPAWSEYVFLWFFSIIFAARAGLALWMGQKSSTLVFGLGVALFVGTALFLRQRTSYAVTRHDVYKSKGLLGKTNRTIPIQEISEVKVRQGPLDRFFGIGAIVLKSKSGKAERLIGVKDPDVVDLKIKALL